MLVWKRAASAARTQHGGKWASAPVVHSRGLKSNEQEEAPDGTSFNREQVLRAALRPQRSAHRLQGLDDLARPERHLVIAQGALIGLECSPQEQ